ncbi:DNA cytosine methyltransferase [Pikeienuella piscinae]|uniref:Cytosine-specific methyltransferase n=1 Tax=Pikeienuella piscinae TaxID=2748098 RepID=A0A7L5BT22_9RHOB|nr:DNA cytosine methyltransferase [Pikeienuella piscinae]QIE54332.1 DNA cytosine methyltransferase [Pikeienuella piscinae]
MPTFYEFFAGGGMTRAGLGPGWTCLFANDFDPKKAQAYRENWGDAGFHLGDIDEIAGGDLPGRADLIWGSFPCQDLSLAGAGAGLSGARSGSFFAFARIIGELAATGRAPRLVAVENVTGALTSHGGRDFAAIVDRLDELGYRTGALVLNADAFVPQSRPRLFVIGAHESLDLGAAPLAPAPVPDFHPPALVRAVAALPEALRARALWWASPAPPRRNVGLSALIDVEAAQWHDVAETERLLSLMSPANLAKLAAAKAAGRRMVGCVFRRTRRDAAGRRAQRAEVRFDDVAGCLRTPAGGSSRQILLVVEGERVRSRLMTPRETARLMGLDDGYVLPTGATDAYHLTGDGVVVPVVRHLAAHVFEPVLAAAAIRAA